MAPLLLLAGMPACSKVMSPPPTPVIAALPEVRGSAGVAPPRINGNVGSTEANPAPQISMGQNEPITVQRTGESGGRGDITLDFADTDIREVVGQILGRILKVNYSIDPAVHGTVTLHTATPLSPDQLLPALQALLAQNGATLVRSGGLYQILPAGPATAAPAAAAGGGPPPTGPLTIAGNETAGSAAVPLRFAGAEELAKALQPFAGTNARIVADPAHNVLLISGDPASRTSLVELIRAFDIDTLAGQSYALLPVHSGNAKDFAGAMQESLRAQSGGSLAGLVRVVPMERVNSVLVISTQPRYIEAARRVFALVEKLRRETVRSWHVYYLQNSHAEDAAYVLQQAFTPNDITAQPGGLGQTAPGQQTRQIGGFGAGLGAGGIGAMGGMGATGGIGGGYGAGTGLGGGLPGAALGGGIAQGGGLSGTSAGTRGTLGGATQPPGNQPTPTTGGQPSANPLFGGLEEAAGGAKAETNAMRIIANPQNNAILIYATPREEDTVQAMLRKIDILPLQVRIDATIAEVTLNDQLKYGTQFFFKAGGINAILNITDAPTPLGQPANTVLNTNFPGFVLSGHDQGGAPLAIQALQAVTSVHVLSSPELMVLDNEAARLQVGNLVPYLTSSTQSQLVPGAPVVNNVNYQPTGVIMEVTPRVNSNGLVTLDIAQEVSDVDLTSPKASGIDSPQFLERNVTSRVVVQDGQTVGLAGLIRDNISRGNSGIPWLKNVPLLGFFAGVQNNVRVRTELLILVTPHVIHDQRDARALTEDLRDQLINAAAVPHEAQTLRPTGSPDPNLNLRRRLQLE
ncbi:MAG: type II secretion system secretin GspD [Acetobacteraceae bacterium]|nr:type II secretion system secretin GspD [Acetobacteraceae bacterium]